jgi:uncharacterized protein
MTAQPSVVDPELKQILACPRCKQQTLDWREDKSEVHCTGCRLAFRIEDGIPVMLVEEARPLP